MSTILLISDNSAKISRISELLTKNSYTINVSGDENEIFAFVEIQKPDLIIFDTQIEAVNAELLYKKLRVSIQKDNIPLIVLINEKFSDIEVLKTAFSIIVEPFSDVVLISSIVSTLRLKNTLDVLLKNNSELAKNLYQLDVLYNTSAQFAGSLDKNKLINIMLEGLEKTLSFSLSYTLVFNDQKDIVLIINSLYPLSKRLEDSIKLRAILSYKALFDEDKLPFSIEMESIKVIKNIKHQFDEYDLPVFNFDNLFSPINISNRFFGLIEVFRQNEFNKEDTTCFQTLSRQVSLPLESALLYEQIKLANIKLEKLERLKSEFISIVSHELRTPLTTIKNALDIILTGKTGILPESAENFLNMAKRNVVRLAGIINDLLDLSKIEAGKMEFRFKKSPINQPLEYIKNAFEQLAKEKNIELGVEIDENLENLYMDSQRIEQVLTNLVSNAIKFTSSDGKVILSAKKVNEKDINPENLIDQDVSTLKGDYIQIDVKDNGIGIDKVNIKRVFDKFAQIENPLSREVGGTGLGLPIAKQLIQAHKGFIWLESEIGVGTTFSIALPVLNDEQIFFVDLNTNIQKAKQEHTNLGMFLIKENQTEKNSLIDAIKEGSVNVFYKTSNSLEFAKNLSNGSKTLLYALSGIDNFALQMIKKKLVHYLETNEKNFDKCAILFSSALYPDDGLDGEELSLKLQSLLKGVKDE